MEQLTNDYKNDDMYILVSTEVNIHDKQQRQKSKPQPKNEPEQEPKPERYA